MRRRVAISFDAYDVFLIQKGALQSAGRLFAEQIIWMYGGILISDALSDHGVRNLAETGDVRSGDHIAFHAVLLRGIAAGGINVLHDVVKLLVDFLKAPAQADGVLGHLQSGGRDAAGVGGLARRIEDARLFISGNGFRRIRHVGALGYAPAAVCKDGFGGFAVDLVLRGAGQDDIRLDVFPHIF